MTVESGDEFPITAVGIVLVVDFFYQPLRLRLNDRGPPAPAAPPLSE
jgi:hypothetical protein